MEYNKYEIEFEDFKLNCLIERLNETLQKSQDNFCEKCTVIYRIWNYCKENHYKAKDNEYYDAYKLLAKFGFEKSEVLRYKNVFLRFMEQCDVAYKLLDVFSPYSSSKLFEMLPVDNSILIDNINRKIITAEMSVKQIRGIIKQLKNGVNPEQKIDSSDIAKELNEDEIPLAYDPKKEYEFSYFESMTKSQLLNIVWELQKYAHKKGVSK